eukprot:2479204-Prymnesium_polylepis.1
MRPHHAAPAPSTAPPACGPPPRPVPRGWHAGRLRIPLAPLTHSVSAAALPPALLGALLPP